MGGERLARGHAVVADPALALPTQREPDLGQHGQIAGAERAELAGERRDAGAQRAEQAVEQAVADPGAARAELVRAHRHRRAHHLDAQRRAAAARMAAEQPPLVLAGILERRGRRAQHADAGGDPVEQLAARDQVATSRSARALRSRASGAMRASARPRAMRTTSAGASVRPSSSITGSEGAMPAA